MISDCLYGREKQFHGVDPGACFTTKT